MFNAAQPAWRTWAANFPAHAASRKPLRDRWLARHGFDTEDLPPPAGGDDDEKDQGEDDNEQ